MLPSVTAYAWIVTFPFAVNMAKQIRTEKHTCQFLMHLGKFLSKKILHIHFTQMRQTKQQAPQIPNCIIL